MPTDTLRAALMEAAWQRRRHGQDEVRPSNRRPAETSHEEVARRHFEAGFLAASGAVTEGLDVERLTEALRRTEGVNLAAPMLARRIAAEYARLSEPDHAS